jgi:hypothetical protein
MMLINFSSTIGCIWMELYILQNISMKANGVLFKGKMQLITFSRNLKVAFIFGELKCNIQTNDCITYIYIYVELETRKLEVTKFWVLVSDFSVEDSHRRFVVEEE